MKLKIRKNESTKRNTTKVENITCKERKTQKNKEKKTEREASPDEAVKEKKRR